MILYYTIILYYMNDDVFFDLGIRITGIYVAFLSGGSCQLIIWVRVAKFQIFPTWLGEAPAKLLNFQFRSRGEVALKIHQITVVNSSVFV